jgi:23S rRNA (uracil-5-)-methyltransferase RumA
MVLSESDQREWKRRILADALARLGGFGDPVLDPVAVVSEELGYRNKVEFSLGRDADGKRVVGLHPSAGGSALVDVPACPLQHSAANAVLGSARQFLLDPDRAAAIRWPGRDEARLVVRRSGGTGQLLVGLRSTTEPFPLAAELAEHLASRHPNLRGVVRITARSRRRGGSRVETLWGHPHIIERVGGQKFRLPAATFLQVNSAASEELVRRVTQAAQPLQRRSVLDLYGGVGAYGFAMSRAGAGSVLVCDADRDAIECGRRAARDSKTGGIRFVHADAAGFLREKVAHGAGFDVVVANPPRTGLGRGSVGSILGVRPSRVVVVSCDPATLARDLRALVEGGCSLQKVTPLDMFPQTAHIEAIALLARSERPKSELA